MSFGGTHEPVTQGIVDLRQESLSRWASYNQSHEPQRGELYLAGGRRGIQKNVKHLWNLMCHCWLEDGEGQGQCVLPLGSENGLWLAASKEGTSDIEPRGNESPATT